VYVQVLWPPPVVAQIGIQNNEDSGDVVVNLLFKTLLDVDGPFTLAQDGWFVNFIGATQHVHLISPADVAALVGDQIDLDDLANVDFTGKVDNSLIYWDADTSTWKVRGPYTLADFVTGTPGANDEIRWTTSGGGHAEWYTPSAPTTSFLGASQGLVTYNNTSGKVTSGSYTFTIASGTLTYARLQYQVSISSGTDCLMQIYKNGVSIGAATVPSMAGSGNGQVSSPVVPVSNGDVFTVGTSGGSVNQNLSIQVW